MDVTIDQLFEEYKNGYAVYALACLALAVILLSVMRIIHKNIPTSTEDMNDYLDKFGPFMVALFLTAIIVFSVSFYNIYRLARCSLMPNYEKTAMLEGLSSDLRRHIVDEIPENAE